MTNNIQGLKMGLIDILKKKEKTSLFGRAKWLFLTTTAVILALINGGCDTPIRNRAPVFGNIDDVIVREGEKVELDPKVRPKVYDPEGDYPITIKYSPPVNSKGRWQTDFNSAGTYPVRVTATDCKGAKAYKDIELIVKDNRIAFVSQRDGTREIYVMDPNGDNQKRLTINSYPDYNPLWSPDGTKIAFYGDDNGNFDIYVMNADGSGLKKLTPNSPYAETLITWSPDSKKLAFRRDLTSTISEIYTKDVETGIEEKITNTNCFNSRPVWSPNGKYLAIESNRDGSLDIHIINLSNLIQTNLTPNNNVYDEFPKWSQNSKEIAYESTVNGNTDIYFVNIETGIIKKITSNPGYDGEVSLSPDGKKLAFTSMVNGTDGEICTMDLTNNNQIQILTNNDAGDHNAIWSPDSKYLAFTSYRTGQAAIWTMNAADGTNQTHISQNFAMNRAPSWK